MLLTLSTTHTPATDLSFLLHKHPARLHSFELSFGRAHVFYSQASAERCTACMLLDVDPVGLVRGAGASMDQYVNDRPYVASSFLSVAIAQVLSSALGGRSKERPDLAMEPIALEATIEMLPCRGGEAFVKRLWEPLGYTVEATAHPLDPAFPEWGTSSYYTVTLGATCRLQDLLTHLYVLVPVLDNDKHYWVGEAEVEKLLRRGEGWLAAHPERDEIARRYLGRRPNLVRSALQRLRDDEGDTDAREVAHDRQEEVVEERISLHTQRLGAVMAVLKQSGAQRVLDLGCGEGRLLRLLLEDRTFTSILGVDVSFRVLERARDRLHLDRLPPRQRERITLMHGALTYRDRRLAGYDAAAVVEVIEHLDPPRLRAFERVLWEHARPATIVATTPNVEYNVLFDTLPAGKFRHRDHRFEWTRHEFETWAEGVAERWGYHVRFLPVGPTDPQHGAPTQMGVWTRAD
jgi:3' terminal RNA ribose 2'-O-methyltransferase Hen1